MECSVKIINVVNALLKLFFCNTLSHNANERRGESYIVNNSRSFISTRKSL